MLPPHYFANPRNGSVVTAPQDVQQFIGRTAVGSDGSKIGDVGQVYLDEQTGQPL